MSTKFSTRVLSNLQFVENLCTFRLCDDEDIPELSRVVRSNANEDIRDIYNLEKVTMTIFDHVLVLNTIS
jgi:hypothetical protein